MKCQCTHMLEDHQVLSTCLVKCDHCECVCFERAKDDRLVPVRHGRRPLTVEEMEQMDRAYYELRGDDDAA